MQRCIGYPQSKVYVTSIYNNYSDVKLKAGCKVGGIEAARLAIGLETGTGEAEAAHENCLTNVQ